MSQPTDIQIANSTANVIRGLGILCLVAMAFRIIPLGYAMIGGLAFFILSIIVRKKLLAKSQNP
ncbi:MAG: hypothetical protein AAB401_21820 [Acidobacteriota bacterium]